MPDIPSGNVGTANTDGAWCLLSVRLVRDPFAEGYGVQPIPERAAYVQIALRTNTGDMRVAGLSLQRLSAPAT